MLERFLEWLKNQSVSFAFFIGGAIIGFLLCIAVYYMFANKERKIKHGIRPVDLSTVVDESRMRILNSETGFRFNDKLTLFYGELKDDINITINTYYGEDAKLLPIPALDKFFVGGLSVPLDFTVYELIGFIDCILDDLEKIYNSFIDDKRFLFIWKNGRSFIARGLDKNPHDVSIAKIIDIASEKIEKAKIANLEPPKRGLFAFIGKKVVKTTMDKLVEPRIAPLIDEALARAVESVVTELSLLFSHNLKGGGAEHMKYLVQSDGEGEI